MVLDDFVKHYIQAYEELKLNLDTLQRGFDKERALREELKQKIQNKNGEKINKNGMCENSCLSIKIGIITIFKKIDGNEIFCTISLDNSDKKQGIKL